MIVSQVSIIKKQRFIESQPNSKLEEWKQEIVNLKGEIQTLEERISETKNTISNKQSQIETTEQNTQKPISDRAAEILLLHQEIKLHQIEIENFESLITSLNEKTPELQESIVMLSALIARREQRQKVEVVLDEFLIIQEAYLAAREKLFESWKENNRPFGWSFPTIPILTKNKTEYQQFK